MERHVAVVLLLSRDVPLDLLHVRLTDAERAVSTLPRERPPRWGWGWKSSESDAVTGPHGSRRGLQSYAPLGLRKGKCIRRRHRSRRLAPWAILFRPSGAYSRAAFLILHSSFSILHWIHSHRHTATATSRALMISIHRTVRLSWSLEPESMSFTLLTNPAVSSRARVLRQRWQ